MDRRGHGWCRETRRDHGDPIARVSLRWVSQHRHVTQSTRGPGLPVALGRQVDGECRSEMSSGCALERDWPGNGGGLKQPVSRRDWDDAHLIDAAVGVHVDDPGYGYRLIADELAELGIAASENRVWRLCSVQRIFSAHSKKRGLNRKPGPPVHDDLLRVVDAHEAVSVRGQGVATPGRPWATPSTHA
jgi:hypothetical protein